MLPSLPAELILAIFKYLPVSAIVACQLTCKDLKAFVDEYETVIFRGAAAHPSLNLIPNEQLGFEDIQSLFSPRFLQGAANWKELCRRGCQVKNSWLGKGPSRIREYRSILPKVHRFKIDEKRGFAVASYQSGGVVVVDLYEDKLLWHVSKNDLPEFTFFDYDEGYLVLVHLDGNCEVWRLVSDDPTINIPGDFNVDRKSRPNGAMLDRARRKERRSAKTHLKFVPHAFLRTPDAEDCTFYLSYPTLMLSGDVNLTLWDIRKGVIVETIDDFASKTWSPSMGSRTLSRPRALLAEAECLGLNATYALITSYSRTIQVFRRQDVVPQGERPRTWDAGECVFELNGSAETSSRWVFTVGDVLPEEFSDDGLKEYLALLDEKPKAGPQEKGLGLEEMVKSPWKRSDKVVVRHGTALSKLHVRPTSRTNYFFDGCFSPCGQHIAGVCEGSKLVIIPYFERVSRGEVKDLDSLRIEVQFNAFERDGLTIAYENDRIAVSTCLGIYIIHIVLPDAWDLDSPPQVHVQRLSRLNDPKSLQEVYRLRITSTALWLTWGSRRIRLPEGSDSLSVSEIKTLQEEHDMILEREEVIHEREMWMKCRDIRANDMNASEGSRGVQVIDHSVGAEDSEDSKQAVDGSREAADESEEDTDDSEEDINDSEEDINDSEEDINDSEEDINESGEDIDDSEEDTEGVAGDENLGDSDYSGDYVIVTDPSGEQRFKYNSLLFSVDFGLGGD